MMNLMPHPPRSLRPLLFPFELSRFFSFSFPLFSKRHSRALSRFNVLPSSASSSYSKRRNIEDQGYSINTVRRTRENLKEDKNRDKGTMMEQALSSSSSAASRSSSSFEFNKRRAEGNDRSEKLKRIPQRKFRELNPSNTIAYVQILGTGMDTQDTSPSVLLFFDKQRFIFNAGEGLQRFCTEHKIRLSKIDHIFLSRVCTETAGGLPGLLLTLAGIGDEGLSVNVWGPSDLKFLVDAMRSFIPRAAMVHTHSFGSDLNKPGDPIVLVDDIVVKISATVIQPHSTEGSEVKPGEMSVIYLCELPEIMGKFDPKKAMALGLRPGPKYSELQSGKSVKSDHKDIMVHPSDVLGPSSPGPIVLLVDCPTSSHAEELMMVESLNHYYSNPDNPTEGKKIVNCIIHLSPDSVISSPTYQSWMKRFGLAQHIIAGHQKKNMEIPILNTSSRIAARLNYLCPQLFPFTGFWSPQIISESSSDSNISEGIRAENLLKFTLRPHANLGPDRSLIPRTLTHVQAIDDLLLEIKDITKAAEDVKQLWSGQDGRQIMTEKPSLSKKSLPNCLENIRRDDMEMAFLGTGSSQPSNYRNVSSIYINLFSKGSLLLDCGEGTLGQLKRRYGVEGADDAVRNLSCIWISHIHADHHSGLARILALRRDLLKDVHHEPILVVGPRQLKRYLDAYQRLEDLDMEYLDCRYTTEASWASFECETDPKHNDKYNNNNDDNSRSTEGTLFAEGSAMQSVWKRPRNQVENFSASPYLKKLKRVLAEAGLETLVSFPVVHCPQSFGAILKAKERLNSLGKKIPGWKIVYSGDTRPCPEIIQASRGATALIHEATFEDGLVEEAVAKNHSTTKEAMEVGSSAGVYRIILTHFSQRYPKIPVIDESHMHNTCIAFDFMSINMADLPVLPQVVPYFKILFRNEMVEDESDSVMDTTEAL